MKQGSATRDVSESAKREPRSHAINVQATADIGVQHHNTNSKPLYEGRGFEAPMQGSTIHHCGSQGKHK